MAKTYAAFYLPQEEKELTLPNQKNVDRISNQLIGLKQKFSFTFSDDECREMTRNIDLQSTTEFTQKYAVGALTKIMNGEPVTNKTMLDSLFNTYAPALNASLAQTGFNSLVEMRNAAQAGNINVANFVQGLSNGLSTVQSLTDKIDYSKYGEEIPVDVVEKCLYKYNATSAHNKIDKFGRLSDYVSDLDNVIITLWAHVKNRNAELWSLNDFSNKLTDIMQKKQAIIFRVGKSIYENCIITRYQPTITNIYDIYFETDIEFNSELNTHSQNNNGTRIMNPRRLIGDFNYNICSEEIYKGIIA